MPRIARYSDAAAFLQVAEVKLAQNEIANNVILGVPSYLRANPEEDSPENLYLTVTDDGRIAGAAVMTPPRNLVIHVEEGEAEPQAALEALVEAALPLQNNVPGLLGRVPWVGMAAELWRERTGVRMSLRVSERVFELREVIWPSKVEGELRLATLEDAPLAAEWFLAFVREALPEDETPDIAERARRAIEQERLYLWKVPDDNGSQDGWRAVSLVAASRPLPRGRNVGPVYTPPAERGKGYASNATAALSALLLEQGHEYTTLFTDLANPTSNKIYQAIGYRPVCDYEMWKVE